MRRGKENPGEGEALPGLSEPLTSRVNSCRPRLVEGLVLSGQRPNQRIVLAGLLRSRELNTVRRKANLGFLLSNKIAYLHQLLGKDLSGRNKRL